MNAVAKKPRRNGPLWITLTLAVTTAAGWFIYDAMMAPTWMRDFGLDIAARATLPAVQSPATAFPSTEGRPDPDSPYICMTNSAAFSWQKVFFVPSGGPIPAPLESLPWDGEGADIHQTRLLDDERYQLIAFVNNGRVVEHGYYFTMWANLEALGRPAGFTPEEAVFSAESDGEVYHLAVANNVPANVCPQ